MLIVVLNVEEGNKIECLIICLTYCQLIKITLRNKLQKISYAEFDKLFIKVSATKGTSDKVGDSCICYFSLLIY
jgi:hypothetical protein